MLPLLKLLNFSTLPFLIIHKKLLLPLQFLYLGICMSEFFFFKLNSDKSAKSNIIISAAEIIRDSHRNYV